MKTYKLIYSVFQQYFGDLKWIITEQGKYLNPATVDMLCSEIEICMLNMAEIQKMAEDDDFEDKFADVWKMSDIEIISQILTARGGFER